MEAQEPPGEAKPANELATKAEEIIDMEEEAKEDDKEIETKEDNEYILKTYDDKKDERDMDIDIDMGIDDSNLEFEEEVELTRKRIVTENKRKYRR